MTFHTFRNIQCRYINGVTYSYKMESRSTTSVVNTLVSTLQVMNNNKKSMYKTNTIDRHTKLRLKPTTMDRLIRNQLPHLLIIGNT